MLIYQWIVATILLLILCNVVANLIHLARTRIKLPQPDIDALVSVLIPCRNEERNIGRCLRGIMTQSHRNLEILVLDDGSTDRTAAIIQGLAAQDSRIRLLTGGELRDGWTGKNNALWQLVQQARGEWLFLTDADDRHLSASIATGLAFAHKHKLDFVTGYPQQLTGGLWEALAVPLLFFFLTLFRPLWLLRHSRNPGMIVANGQYLLIKHELYRKVGGHEAVRNVVNEDFAMAGRIKAAGGRLDILDLRGLCYSRMYRGLGDALAGFSKNIYLIMGRNALALWLGFVGLAVLFLCPFLISAWSLIVRAGASEWLWISLVQVGLVLTIRAALTGFQRLSFAAFWLEPLGMLLYLFIFVRSFWEAEFGQGPSWKGRTYNVRDRKGGFA